ncbi:MAG: hypothetical protein PWQ48_605 [Thermotogaceae bacterium]|jgi:parvulin-like peptidyl-prolyl isomerase|nr:hypothetical protein [Thermotogaceae bacterium]
MREWMKKWSNAIVWTIAIFFILGIVWWSVAAYIGSRRTTTTTNTVNTPSAEDAAVVLTKDGTPMSHEYWIMPDELESRTRSFVSTYQQLGYSYDDVFDEPLLRLSSARDLVNGKVVDYYAAKNNISPTKEQINKELENIVSQYTKDPNTENLIKQTYGSVDRFKELLKPTVETNLIRQMVQDEVATVTQADLEKYFNENKDNLKETYEQVKAKHILVETEEQAKEILKKIKSGELTFEDAAKEYSIDTSNKDQGGDLGWVARNSLVKEFADAAFSATPNVITGPVETPYGWHLIKVEDKKLINSLDDLLTSTSTAEQIKSTISNDKFRKWLEDFKNQENISYKLQDPSLELYEEYYNLITSATDTSSLNFEPFIVKLEDILYTGDSTKINPEDKDPTLISLYVTVLEKERSKISEKAQKYSRYQTLSKSINPAIMNLSDEEVEKKIEEIDTKLENASGTEYQKLFQEKMSYRDLQDFRRIKKELEDSGIDLSKIDELAKEYKAKEDEITEKLKDALYALYELAPYSQRTVEKLYNYDPMNPEIRLAYYKNHYQQLKPYVTDKEIFQAYQSQLLPDIYNTLAALELTSLDDKIATDLRIQAYETLVEIAEDLNLYEDELRYLEGLKELKPDYQGLDGIIQEVKQKIEESKQATSTTSESTSSTSSVSTASSQ